MITPGQSTKLLESIGICFLFAQNYHASMKYVAPVRKELGIRTLMMSSFVLSFVINVPT